MKKVSAISFAAFYLLLTTGLYVCILHCTADYFLGTHKTEVAKHSEKADQHKEKSDHHEEKSDGKEKKECGKDADCSCCNTHGQYAVKENVPVGPKIHVATFIISIDHSNLPGTLVSWPEITAITWPHGNAPPFNLKEPLYISYRSILI